MSAALERVLGYGSAVGAYHSREPHQEWKSVRIAGQQDFACQVDLLDVEEHTFPYTDGAFDLVLCCEIIEHLLRDPMHMLFECHRVLRDRWHLLVTTPNVASLSSVACVLHGWRNPQLYSCYSVPGDSGTPHVREYTPRELADAISSAGFEIESLFTERLPDVDEGSWVLALLEDHGFDTSLRGEQIYRLARKGDPQAPRVRYPSFLYASPGDSR
jgi:predicted SAM-dependent methyltransferase